MFGRKTRHIEKGHQVDTPAAREVRHSVELRLLRTRVAALEETVSDLRNTPEDDIVVDVSASTAPSAFAEAWDRSIAGDDPSERFFELDFAEGPARRWFLTGA